MKKLFNLFCLLLSGQIVFSQGVGIGTSTPHAPLQFANLTGNRKIVLWEISNDDHRFYGLGINGGTLRYQISDTLNQHIFYAGVNSTTSNELMRITGRGFVGIGNSMPHAPLHFDNGFANRKIVLSENMDGDHSFYGFGTELFAMRYQVAAPAANHIFYAATSSTSSKELMRITGSGRVGIGTAEPFENLEVGGNGRVFFGDGASENRRGLLIDGIEDYNASRIEAFNYANGGSGRNLIINTSGGGNVGIGIITPAQKLHVNGSAVVTENLGIGTSSPNAPLEFAPEARSRKVVLVSALNNDNMFWGFGVDTSFLRYQIGWPTSSHVFLTGTSPFSSDELMRITGTGYVGIGNSNPHAPLQFRNDERNGKIVLWEGSNSEHDFIGFGINNGNLRYQVRNTSASHVFYAGASSGGSNELMRIKGDGNVDVAGSLQIGYIRVQSSEVEVSPFSSGSASCNCPSGTNVVGGGYVSSNNGTYSVSSYPNSDTSWQVKMYNDSFSSSTIHVWAICARLAN